MLTIVRAVVRSERPTAEDLEAKREFITAYFEELDERSPSWPHWKKKATKCSGNGKWGRRMSIAMPRARRFSP
jgi:hypothetical protein